MKYLNLPLALALVGCGYLQTDGLWDIFDIGFVGLALVLVLGQILGADEEFWKNLGR